MRQMSMACSGQIGKGWYPPVPKDGIAEPSVSLLKEIFKTNEFLGNAGITAWRYYAFKKNIARTPT
jgi:hypothetical protein